MITLAIAISPTEKQIINYSLFTFHYSLNTTHLRWVMEVFGLNVLEHLFEESAGFEACHGQVV